MLYALVIACVTLLLHGFLLAVKNYVTPRLLAFGAVTAGLGSLFALLARPEDLANGGGFALLSALFLADLCRIVAAAVGVSLARYVSSPAVALLIAAVAAASDLFSVFAGPTRALGERESAVLWTYC